VTVHHQYNDVSNQQDVCVAVHHQYNDVSNQQDVCVTVHHQYNDVSNQQDVCVTVHHQYHDVSNQQDANFSFINLFKSALHVSGDKFAHHQEQFFDCIYSFWYNAPTLLLTSATGQQQCRCIVPKLYIQSKKCS
jgi:hypothetical protein